MLNKIIAIGNLECDMQMSYKWVVKAVTKFSLKVTRRTGDRETGERNDDTTRFNIVDRN